MIHAPLPQSATIRTLRRLDAVPRFVGWLIVLGSMFGAGCATTPPATTEYLLRSRAPHTLEQSAPVHIERLTVRVAPYLDRASIVVETANREINPAQQHLWAEPLHEALQSLLLDEIGQALGGNARTNLDAAARYEVDVAIDQFHGALDGRVRLVADCRIMRAGAVVRAFRFADTVEQSSAGYASMVDAHADLATRLAGAIAQTLRPAS